MTIKEKTLFVLQARDSGDPRYIELLIRMQVKTTLDAHIIERKIKELAQ